VYQQQRAIDDLNRRLGSSFRVFKGIESDILADGSLDYDEKVLRTFDLIIAGVHSRFRMNREEQTARIVKAVENPYDHSRTCDWTGYCRGGRVTNWIWRRYSVPVQCTALPSKSMRTPWRLDLDWRWCQRALELGCMLSINPDAHATHEIDHMRWGVLMARKGAVPKERVLNSLGTKDFAAYLRERKRRAARSTGFG
jgi:DNA polymerase (family X)